MLRHRNRVNRYLKLDDRTESHLTALPCGPAPDGHDQWTMQALAGKVVELGLVTSLSPETVRLRLKNALKPWLKRQWCIPKVGGEFVAAMEDVLDLCAEHYDS